MYGQPVPAHGHARSRVWNATSAVNADDEAYLEDWDSDRADRQPLDVCDGDSCAIVAPAGVIGWLLLLPTAALFLLGRRVEICPRTALGDREDSSDERSEAQWNRNGRDPGGRPGPRFIRMRRWQRQRLQRPQAAGGRPGETFWVSPQGSDDAAGTESAPFLTLERARDAVRALDASAWNNDVAVNLREGTYRLERPSSSGRKTPGRTVTTWSIVRQGASTRSSPGR